MAQNETIVKSRDLDKIARELPSRRERIALGVFGRIAADIYRNLENMSPATIDDALSRAGAYSARAADALLRGLRDNKPASLTSPPQQAAARPEDKVLPGVQAVPKQ